MARGGQGRKTAAPKRGRTTPAAPGRSGAKAKAAAKAGSSPRSKSAAKSWSGRAAKPRRPWRRSLLRLGALATIWGVVAVGAVVAFLYLTLPDLEDATRLNRGATAALLDKDGAFIASYGELRGEMTTVADLPAHLPQAVVAIEDRRFYEHFGVDLWGVARAIVVNVRSGQLRQGASTITQQLARNLLLTQERSFARKAREAILALELERRFDKDQILSIYLNRVYFGGGAYGVDAAARRFFGKSARDADLWESALLAGALKAPTRLAPDRNPEGAAARARLVLNAMVETGVIRKDAADPMAVVMSAATARPAPRAGDARYFADWALDQTEGFMAGLDRDVLVETTLDLGLQRVAERAVAAGLQGRPETTSAKSWPSQAALVAMTPDGAVRAMVGGRDYVESQFNRAVQARRQLGSVFKPFVYLAALEAGLDPYDQVEDAPIAVGDWRPRNFKGRYYGAVTLREALARSLNAPAVRLAEQVGRRKVVIAARRLGIASPMPSGPSVSLGAGAATLLEVTVAYAAFAAGGAHTPPYGVVEIRSRDGAIDFRPAISRTQAISPAVAAKMNHMLAAVMTMGSGRSARLDREAAGKTGTSQRGRDAWFIGYTADLVAGVWVGHDDNRPIDDLTGGGLPARIWHAFMAEAATAYPARSIPGASDYAPPAPPAVAPKPAERKTPRVVYEYPTERGGGND